MAFLLGHAALVVLACHIVLMFVVENIWAQEEMAIERHGREPAGLNSTGSAGHFQSRPLRAPVLGEAQGHWDRPHTETARTAT